MTFHQSGFATVASRDGHEGGWSESFIKLGALIEVLKHSDREMVITRVIAAPAEKVFAAFSDPAHIGKWWGPNGFTTTTHEMDFRVGGVWRYTMHGPDGTDYANYVTYTEIVNPSRIAYEHGSNAQHPSEFKAVITFEPEGDGIKVSLRMIVGDATERDGYVKFGAVEGGQQTLERLAAHLAGKAR
ncbi:MAG: SRPBCC domain-containing protein [Rhizobiales bacterium]|nr:SRPBCC domain-containing protein [Hyphomicrobiales bacterium]